MLSYRELRNRYAVLLAKYPISFVLSIGVISLTLISLVCFLGSTPDFSDPQAGFLTRGTHISKRLITWHNLVDALDKKFLLHEPVKFESIDLNPIRQQNESVRTTRNKSNVTNVDFNDYDDEMTINATIDDEFEFESFFCGNPDLAYSKIIIAEPSHQNLLTYPSLRSMCLVETKLRENVNYCQLCEMNKQFQCCRVWSLANYATALVKKSSCLDLTFMDYSNLLDRIELCRPYYLQSKIYSDCAESGNCAIPIECAENNIMYNIFHFIVDQDFIYNRHNVTNVPLKYVAVFIPVAASEAAFQLWKNFASKQLQFPSFEIVGIDFGVKEYSFGVYLLRDTFLLAFGTAAVMLCVWLNTGSLYLSISTIFGVVLSTGVGYFVYQFVYGITFFPFMNLLVLILAIGVGVDDAFIFTKIWRGKAHTLRSEPLVKMLSETLNESLRSMFVTSLTTAVAFFATAISNITAMRCFGIFAGTTLLVNFLFMVSWFAANVVLSYRFEAFESKYLFRSFFGRVQQRFDLYFGERLFVFIEKTRWCSLILFVSFTLAASFAIFVTPQFKLSRAKDFQLFHSEHLFERYDKVLKYKFDYIENPSITNDIPEYTLPLKFVWGIKARDNGFTLDPNDMGSLTYDKSFNMSSPSSQKFLLHFCKRLRRQPFFLKSNGFTFLNCFIEAYVEKMKRKCIRFSNPKEICCERNEFPYEPELFDYCLKEFLQEVYSTPKHLYDPEVAGPKFSASDLAMRALIVEFDSTCSYSIATGHIDQFFKTVEKWMRSQNAPPGMKHGWFVSDLEFYDLQRSLISATVLSTILSLFISFVIFFCCTWNLLLTCLAIITILQVILTTMGILVLFQWELNIIESIALTTTIGLSVDYCVHYAIYYHQVFRDMTRREATKLVVAKMAEPSFMAALTTIVTGLLMLCSVVLPYIKIGIFLIVITSVSWLYSTFFFCSVLLMCGPEFGCAQISCKNIFLWKSQSENQVQINRDERVEIHSLVSKRDSQKNSGARPCFRSEGSLSRTAATFEGCSSQPVPGTSLDQQRPLNEDLQLNRTVSLPYQINFIVNEFHSENWQRLGKDVPTTEL